MKKWVGLLVSLLLIMGMISASIFPGIPKKKMPKEANPERYRIILIQDEEKKEQTDPHMILVLKELSKKLDEWLKKLNERIESEDITRLEVRFLEVLRNILEWIKEKIDAKIESSEKENPVKKEKKGLFREAHQPILKFSKIG